jgi:hypothetical protein
MHRTIYSDKELALPSLAKRWEESLKGLLYQRAKLDAEVERRLATNEYFRSALVKTECLAEFNRYVDKMVPIGHVIASLYDEPSSNCSCPAVRVDLNAQRIHELDQQLQSSPHYKGPRAYDLDRMYGRDFSFVFAFPVDEDGDRMAPFAVRSGAAYVYSECTPSTLLDAYWREQGDEASLAGYLLDHYYASGKYDHVMPRDAIIHEALCYCFRDYAHITLHKAYDIRHML